MKESKNKDKDFDKRFWDCVEFCKENPIVANVILQSIIDGKRITCKRPGECKKFPCACLACED
jgi:hypothetical protein